MKTILVFILATSLFAITPFSLEGISSVNVKILDKSKLLKKSEKEKLLKKIKQEIEKLGITPTSENFTNLTFRVKSIKVENTYVLNVTLAVVEDVVTDDGTSVEKLGITYLKSDFFDTKDLTTELPESIEYLLEEFVEQYREEN